MMNNMVTQYYFHLLGTDNSSVQPYSVSQIQSLHQFRCSAFLSVLLSAIPIEEIKSTLFALRRNKAPGPDCFTVEFFVTSWELVGADLISAVKDFFISSSLPRQVNATVIALIPKVTGASKLVDFRPISLCNTVYKVISRILASRLRMFTSDAVQRNQVGFVKGRQLCENVLLASKLVVDFHKSRPSSRGCLQVDITKAYDNVNWSLILNILKAFQLPKIFTSWIYLCISTPLYSIALNGELQGFFQGKKGLRQGDPISSSLFILAIDLLSKELDIEVTSGRIRPHPLCLIL